MMTSKTAQMTTEPATETAAAIAAQVAEARARAARGLADGTTSGIALAHQLTADINAIVTRLAVGELSASSRADAGVGRVAMLATGGFGRREFAPYSDLDLIFLFEREPDEAGQELAQRILHPLWDARL